MRRSALIVKNMMGAMVDLPGDDGATLLIHGGASRGMTVAMTTSAKQNP